jgi:hypothetical protein
MLLDRVLPKVERHEHQALPAECSPAELAAALVKMGERLRARGHESGKDPVADAVVALARRELEPGSGPAAA